MLRGIRVISLCLSVFFSLSVWAALPEKFFEVSPGIYRSAQPAVSDLADLKALGIRTILDLNDDEDSIFSEREGAEALGIEFISHAMSGFWSPKDEQVNLSLEVLRDQSRYPVLVHCQHGEDRTGLIIGLHRVQSEGWAPATAYKEMLERGFHRILFMLDGYFKDRVGL